MECPIQKYLDADSKLSISQPEATLKDKNKKGEFAKEVLAFYKKRKNNE